MHRSGTSAVTRVLNLLGATLPAVVLPADQGNGEGYWEPATLISANDHILHSVQRGWFDWRPLNQPATEQWVGPLAGEIGRQFPAGSPFVLKDPRVCLLVPLYQQALASLNVEVINFFVVRNPMAISASLEERNGFNPSFGQLLWLHYELEAERSTRDRRRTFVQYENVLSDWRPQLGAVAAMAGLKIPAADEPAGREIDAFLKPSNNHYATPAIAGPGRLKDWVQTTYDALRALGKDAYDAAAIAELDAVYAECQPMMAVFGDASYGEIVRREARALRYRSEVRELKAREEQYRSHIAKLTGAPP